MEIPWRIESIHPYRMDTRTHIQLLFFRHNNIMTHKLVLWEPTNGPARRVRKTITYVDTLKEDSGLEDINEKRSMMLNRYDWRDKTKMSRELDISMQVSKYKKHAVYLVVC